MSEGLASLAQACSSHPIQNSLYIPTQHYCALPPLFWRGGTGVRTPLAQACSLCPIQNSLYIPHTALLRIGGCPKSFKSTITPHTLSNFQSLTKLITLIINNFWFHCRGEWQFALTKQNFSNSPFFT